MNNKYMVGEFEEMDLSSIKDKSFMVSINSGPRNENQYACSALCGPFDFFRMCETVGQIFEEQLVHAKVMITQSEFGSEPQFLDENTVDFIEARYQDILMEGLLTGDIHKSYTCEAGFNLTNQEIEQKKHEKAKKEAINKDDKN